MTRPKYITIPLLAIGLVGMCGFLWYSYRFAKPRAVATPAPLTEMETSAALVRAHQRAVEITARMQSALSGSAPALSDRQVAKLVQLLGKAGDTILSDETEREAQRFLSDAQMEALRVAYADAAAARPAGK